MNRINRMLMTSKDYFGVNASSNISVRLAKSEVEIERAQRLRQQVFSMENRSEQLISKSIDVDRFDDQAYHMLAFDIEQNEVVGCFRIITSEHDCALSGFYSEQSYDIDFGTVARSNVIELSRSCIHPDYRDGSVLRPLWKKVFDFVQQRNEQYVIGCPSVPALDGGWWGASIHNRLRRDQKFPPPIAGRPLCPLKQEINESNINAVLPPLIKGYVRTGALLAGAPHLDAEFGTVDLLMVYEKRRGLSS